MEDHRSKESYSKSIVFHGAVKNIEGDINAAQIICEVKQRIDSLATGGGCVLFCCNNVMDVSPENIISVFQTAREYGHCKK